MPATVLQASLSATAGGVDLTPYLLDFSCDYGLGPANARLTLTELPEGVDRWDEVTITGGIVGRNVAQRFAGYVLDWQRKHWTPTVTVRCGGYLSLAGRIKAPTDSDASLQDEFGTSGNIVALGTWTDPVSGIVYTTYAPAAVDTSTPATYNPPGVDLTAAHAGKTDAAMVTQILTACGLGAKLGGIGGTARVLGTQAFEQFVWRRSQSALAVIQGLDGVSLGFRTMDSPTGTIVRVLAGPRTPSGLPGVTLAEGVDILDGASAGDLGSQLANRVLVEGWSDGSGKRVALASGAHPSPPPGVEFETKKYSSSLIEKAYLAEAGAGLSCQEVALWHLREDGTLWTRSTIPTWRDDSVAPGDQIPVTASHLGLSGDAWVEGVRCSVSQARVWKQELTVVSRTQPTEALLGGLVLAADLFVNP